MLDIRLIREQPEVVREAIRFKHCDESVLDRLLDVDERRRTLRQDTELKQAEQNQASQALRNVTDEERDLVREKLRALSETIKSQNARLTELDEEFLALMRQIPNIPSKDVPAGASDKENVVVRTEGAKREFSFTPKDHEQLALALDLLDMERGAKVSGSKFYYLKNELVILEQAVLRYALDRLIAKGFVAMTVPNLVRAEAMYGAGHFSTPEDPLDGDAYAVSRDGLFLAGTAEVGLVNYHAGEILPEGELTLRYAGISTSYRREAGTYGKEARGLYRVHQFNKVEMVALTRPEDSEREHELLLSLVEELMNGLGLPYQVILNCGGDLGLPQVKKWDVEAWMPGMGKYGETHSCSNDTDYQARSLNIRFRRSGSGREKEVGFVHTLNNTAFASPRILIPILENYQQEDGSIMIPEVLVPYTGFREIRRK